MLIIVLEFELLLSFVEILKSKCVLSRINIDGSTSVILNAAFSVFFYRGIVHGAENEYT